MYFNFTLFRIPLCTRGERKKISFYLMSVKKDTSHWNYMYICCLFWWQGTMATTTMRDKWRIFFCCYCYCVGSMYVSHYVTVVNIVVCAHMYYIDACVCTRSRMCVYFGLLLYCVCVCIRVNFMPAHTAYKLKCRLCVLIVLKFKVCLHVLLLLFSLRLHNFIYHIFYSIEFTINSKYAIESCAHKNGKNFKTPKRCWIVMYVGRTWI